MAEKIKNSKSEIVVLDGARRLGDIEFIKQLPGFMLVGIETDLKIQYERLVARGENVGDKIKLTRNF